MRLEAEGLIRRRKGADTIVNPGAAEIVARFDQQAEYADVLRDAGFDATVELLEQDVVALSGTDAERLATRRAAARPADGEAVAGRRPGR